MFNPTAVYMEKGAEEYYLGKLLLDRYRQMDKPIITVDDHNKIPQLRNLPDRDFIKLKRYLIIGIRKSVRLVKNERSADWIVPFTSSGCSAYCLYCYLNCTFFKNSYLRVFVNREDIWKSIARKHERLDEEALFEIGSNSDMVLEDCVTGNLQWAIEKFAGLRKGRATFATKFAGVDKLLSLDHRGKTQARISVNPADIVKRVEIGTSSLEERVKAANKLYHSGYKVGINIAPVILVEDWEKKYSDMFDYLESSLARGLKKKLFFEVIFMTYGLANEKILAEAMPNAVNLLDRNIMKPKGRGKYCYKKEVKLGAEKIIKDEIKHKFPGASISYIC
ncbi:MAG: spore photoproduct lyase [Clostridiales bacterium]|nr:spore photoproduct lyase [Clostridiales bacterium]MCF8022211.1 spore photoproduct lyase [Clostridiales bacterium]